jgi:hypothetical protein
MVVYIYYLIEGGDKMTGKMKRAILALMIVITLGAGYGCATASVGFGYHVPVTSHFGTGIYFGFGF